LLVASFLVLAGTPAFAALHEGDVAPPFTVTKAKGGALSLATYKGKPLYVNFFASWCGPCNDEAGAVSSLYKKYRAKGLQVVGVNVLENSSKALGFAQKYNWTFDVATDDGSMGSTYQVVALPVHVFIDRRGKISTYRLGIMEPNEIEDAIKKVLAVAR